MYPRSWSNGLRAVVALLSCFIVGSLALDQSASHTVTIHAWPLTAPSPSPYLEILYDQASSATKVAKVHPLDTSAAENGPDTESSLVRVGLWDAASKTWRSTVTAASTLDDRYPRKVSLHLDERGDVWHVTVRRAGLKEDKGSTNKGKKSQQSTADIQVELVRTRPAPVPVLNQPVVLDERGRMPEKEPEKSFLQRYWWLFLALAFLAMAGGGEK